MLDEILTVAIKKKLKTQLAPEIEELFPEIKATVSESMKEYLESANFKRHLIDSIEDEGLAFEITRSIAESVAKQVRALKIEVSVKAK